jgi:hypothetical protein
VLPNIYTIGSKEWLLFPRGVRPISIEKDDIIDVRDIARDLFVCNKVIE